MNHLNTKAVNFVPLFRVILRNHLVHRCVTQKESSWSYASENCSDETIESMDQNNFPNNELDTSLPKTHEEYLDRKKLLCVSPENSMSLSVAVIGLPNAGKSTLVNELVGTRISSISKRPHTTRRNIVGIMNDNLVQVVFMDTPGLVTGKHSQEHSLEQTFISHPEQSSRVADLILVVVDASNSRDRESLNPGVIEKLRKYSDKPAALVINKVDVIGRKRRLIDISTRLSEGYINGEPLPGMNDKYLTPPTEEQECRRLINIEERIRRKGHIVDIEGIVSPQPVPTTESRQVGWKNFDQVFMVSALERDGVDELKDYLISKAVVRPWSYHPSLITPLAPSQIVYNAVREKLLENLPQEIPYTMSMQIQSWDVTRSGTIALCIDLYAPKSRYVSIVLGPQGKTIQKIATESRSVLCDAFKSDVVIQLVVKNHDPATQNRHKNA